MPLGAFPFVIRNSTQSLGGGREGDIGEAEIFAAGLVGSPLGKEWMHERVSLVSSSFRLESVSTKPAALLPMSCRDFDFICSNFFPLSEAVAMQSPIYMNAEQNDTKMVLL